MCVLQSKKIVKQFKIELPSMPLTPSCDVIKDKGRVTAATRIWDEDGWVKDDGEMA